MTSSHPSLRARRPRCSVVVAAVIAAGLALGACGDDRDDAVTTTAAAPQTTGAADTTTPSSDAPATTDGAVQPTQIDVTLSEFKVVIPAEIPAGFVRVSATNKGTLEHHLILAKLHDGVTVDQLLQTMATDQAAGEALIDYRGGPNGIVPGATESVQLNLDPGNYIALCVIPDKDGMPHVAHGMFAPVTVTGDAKPADLATMDVDATISLTDYDFTISDTFTGMGNVLVTDNAPQAHEVAVYRIGEGGSMDEFMKMLANDPSITPEIAARYTLAGGMTPIATGTSAIVEFHLEPGDYIFICFVSDAKDHLPHFLHKMMKMVTVAG